MSKSSHNMFRFEVRKVAVNLRAFFLLFYYNYFACVTGRSKTNTVMWALSTLFNKIAKYTTNPNKNGNFVLNSGKITLLKIVPQVSHTLILVKY